MSFHSKMVKLRKINGFTQETFATEVGVSRQSVYKWETGQSYPDAEKMMAVCNMLSISPNELLNCCVENGSSTVGKGEKNSTHDWVFDLFWIVMFASGYGLFVAPFFAIATPANWVVMLGMVMMFVPTVLFVAKGILRLIRKLKKRK